MRSIVNNLKSAGCMLVALASQAAWASGAAPSTAPDNPPPRVQRVIVHTVADWPSAADAARRAAQIAGVPVVDATAVAPRQIALSLRCATDAACTQAVDRLAADRGFASAVEPDTRARIPRRPASAAAR